MNSSRLDLIKKLRSMTQAGFSLCADALAATNNDLEAAVRWLRHRGIAQARQKQARLAGDGKTGIVHAANRAILYQLRCETDFVARNQQFTDFFTKLGTALLTSKISSLDEVNQVKIDSQQLNEAILALSAQLGEKIALGKVLFFSKNAEEIFGVYDHHQGKSSGIVILSGTTKVSFAEALAMHVVAMRPQFIDLASIPSAYQAQEKASLQEAMAERFTAQQQEDSALQEKIIAGKLQKQFKEITLLEQKNIHNEKETIRQTLARENAKIIKMGWITKEQ